MVRARLHVICGNCGCSDMFSWEICERLNDDTGESTNIPVLACGNCSTLHFIDDYFPEKANQ